MRLDLDSPFFLVVDPSPNAVLSNCCFAETLRRLEDQFRGGLTEADRPSPFTDRVEAERVARSPSRSARDARAWENGLESFRDAIRVEFRGTDGELLYAADISDEGEEPDVD